jgi:hypothetical protein
MYDIKYFFSIKLIRQFRGGKNIFQEGTNYRKYYRKTLIFKIQGAAVPQAEMLNPLLYKTGPRLEILIFFSSSKGKKNNT